MAQEDDVELSFFSLHPLTCDLVQNVTVTATMCPIFPYIGNMFHIVRPLVPYCPPEFDP